MTFFRYFIRALAAHPTAANLFMAVFILMGVITVGDLKRETFPDFSPEQVEITAAYPGASSIDVETSICRRIEDAIEDVPNIHEITSIAREGVARVVVEMRDDADVVQFFNDLKTEVETITDFPDKVEDVIVKPLNRTDQVLSIAVTGPMNPIDLELYCQSLKDRLKRRELISQIDLLGFSSHQFRIEVKLIKLMTLGLSASDLAAVIGSQNIDLPAGSIETADSNILIRFIEEKRTVRDLENLVVASGKHGDEILLGDIAKITQRFKDEENKILFNGQRAGMLQINKTKAEDSLKIMDDVMAFLDEERKRVPPDVKLVVTQNISEIVRDRLQLLVVNGVQGLILVFLAMWLFFSFRFSFWVAWGLPISFLGTIFVMKQIGFSLNMMTMVGLLIAIGLLMDDAIVISENIAANMDKGKKPLDAVSDGVSEVSAGVVSSFLTTLFIFGSLAVFIEGDIGKVLYAVPVVLIITLSVSLIEAFCILPNHLSHALEHSSRSVKGRLNVKVDSSVVWLKEKALGPIVDTAVNYRYLFIGLVIFTFIVSIAMVAGGVLKVRAFPDTDGDVLQAYVLLPQGSPLERTESVVDRLIDAIKKLDKEFSPLQPDQQQLIKNYTIIYNSNANAGESGPHAATISLDLLNAEIRNTTIDEITGKWREYAGTIPDATSIVYTEPMIGPAGLPIEIRLQGTRLDRLKAASNQLIAKLYAYQGVQDLADDLRPGKPELLITLNKGALAKGLNASMIAGQLRSAFYGITADEIQAGENSYDIDVRIAESDADTVSDLERFYIIKPDGQKVPLLSVVEISEGRGYSQITRIDGIRTITITGDVNTEKANTAEIIRDVQNNFLPGLKKDFPDIRISTEGQARETKTSMRSMMKAFIIGTFGVFVLLSIQFKSYFEPLFIMSAIPLALIGVIWGHIFMGIDLCMPSVMGLISLAGIVVNDSILLVTFIKGHLARGEEIAQASKNASRDRFRAVLLTSATTVLGLLPLLTERSLQAQILIPLACSIVFGLLASTVLILVVIPTIYAISGDFDFIEVGAKSK